MNVRRLLGAALLFIACGHGLPSATPLGGKLEDEEEGPTADRRAPETDGGAEPEKAAESVMVDAGTPADAAVAKEEPTDAGALADGQATVAASGWAGEYVGSDVTTTRLSSMPERVQPDDKARTRVEESKSGRLSIVILDSSNGNTLCALSAQAKGTSADIASGQSCFGSEQLEAEVDSGKAELSGNRLVFDLQVSLKVEGQSIGSIEYHFDGKRK